MHHTVVFVYDELSFHILLRVRHTRQGEDRLGRGGLLFLKIYGLKRRLWNMSESLIPRATLGRLPMYLEYLQGLPLKDDSTISAAAIARGLELGEVMVRKDLAAVSGSGRPKVGYVAQELICALQSCLEQSSNTKAVLIGAGKLRNTGFRSSPRLTAMIRYFGTAVHQKKYFRCGNLIDIAGNRKSGSESSPSVRVLPNRLQI